MISVQKERKLEANLVKYILYNLAEETNSPSELQFKFDEHKHLFGFEVDVVGIESTDEGFTVAVKMESDKRETFRTFFIKKFV